MLQLWGFFGWASFGRGLFPFFVCLVGLVWLFLSLRGFLVVLFFKL